MNTKKIILSIAFFVTLFTNVIYANPTLLLDDKADNYKQTETGYVLNFNLTANQQEFETIKNNALNLSDRVTFETTKIGDNKYGCTFTINHQNQPEYAYKMLLSCGFSDITYKGQTYGLDKIIEILYSYQ
jgi:hypothetical protein